MRRRRRAGAGVCAGVCVCVCVVCARPLLSFPFRPLIRSPITSPPAFGCPPLLFPCAQISLRSKEADGGGRDVVIVSQVGEGDT